MLHHLPPNSSSKLELHLYIHFYLFIEYNVLPRLYSIPSWCHKFSDSDFLMEWVFSRIERFAARYLTNTNAVSLPDVPIQPISNVDFDRFQDVWDVLLSESVKPGIKNGINLNLLQYSNFVSGNGYHPQFQQYLDYLNSCKISTLSSLQRKALFINAYNAFAIRMIVDYFIEHGEGPLSITKICGNDIWKLQTCQIDGNTYSLNDIEHGVLRRMGDPRIHSAIVCCSVSCPDLRNEAFTSEKLEEQLEDQVQSWISNPKKGVAIEGTSANASKIFLWFEEDFQPNVKSFISKYNADITKTKNFSYFEYDWGLNGNFGS